MYCFTAKCWALNMIQTYVEHALSLPNTDFRCQRSTSGGGGRGGREGAGGCVKNDVEIRTKLLF